LLFVGTADTYTKMAGNLEKLATQERSKELQKYLLKVADTFEKVRKLEARVATDEELKQSDSLNYFARDTQAAKVSLSSLILVKLLQGGPTKCANI
jgi:sorting nexin-5/6/32